MIKLWRSSSSSSRGDASTPLPALLSNAQIPSEPSSDSTQGIAARWAGSIFSAIRNVMNLSATTDVPTPLTPHDTIDWDVRPDEDHDPDSSDDEQNDPVSRVTVNARFQHLLRRPLFKPNQRWSWATHLLMENPQVLVKLGTSGCSDITIKKGILGDMSLTYMSRSWSLSQRMLWQGFYSELALFASALHLRRLQGDGIPSIIGLYVNAESIDVAMELPHDTFWKEARPNMPDLMKERFIQAFEKIHKRGVVHGDVRLRHMLIGADGKVTITGFNKSAGLFPIEEVGLPDCNPVDFEYEIRMVKAALDYQGARERELGKIRRAEELKKAHLRREALKEKERLGKYSGPLPEEQFPSEEDVREPPLVFTDESPGWMRRIPTMDRVFIVPGHTDEDVEAARAAFDDLVERMRRGEDPPIVEKPSSADPSGSSGSAQSHNLRKRKISDITNQPKVNSPLKRLRLPPSASADPEDFLLFEDNVAEETPPDRSRPPPTYEKSTSKSYSYFGNVDLPVASSSSGPSKPIKKRDFASEPYDGPRGYYVPHPPTENRMAIERRKFICLSNEAECRRLGLPYCEEEMTDLAPPHFKRRVGKHPVAMGSLKKRLRDCEDPVAAWKEKQAKETKMSSFGFEGSDSLMAEAWVDGPEVLDLRHGSVLTHLEYAEARETATTGLSTSSRRIKPLPRRSILRKPAPVQPISYMKIDWMDDADLQLSPKIGPKPLAVPITEKMPLLHSYVDESLPPRPEPKDEPEVEVDTRSEPPPAASGSAVPPPTFAPDIMRPDFFGHGPGPQPLRRMLAYGDLSIYLPPYVYRPGSPPPSAPAPSHQPPTPPPPAASSQGRSLKRTASALDLPDLYPSPPAEESDGASWDLAYRTMGMDPRTPPPKRRRTDSSTNSESRHQSSSHSSGSSAVAGPSGHRSSAPSSSSAIAGPSRHRSSLSNSPSTMAGPSRPSQSSRSQSSSTVRSASSRWS